MENFLKINKRAYLFIRDLRVSLLKSARIREIICFEANFKENQLIHFNV